MNTTWHTSAPCASADPEAARPFSDQLDLSDSTESFKRRFWSKVDKRGPDDCWLWTAYCKAPGYGQFTLRKGRFITASRVAHALINGPVDAGQVVCHRCDNPPCCNPAHLFAGSNADNAIDCVAKGRANRSRGVAHRDARLNPEIVRRIRTTPIGPGTKTELAREFGVSFTAINRVLARKTWKEVQ